MNKKILIVSSNYYTEISNNLELGSINTLKENGYDYDLINAPGCFEIPYIIKENINNYIGFISLGCIIKGETYHFEVLAHETARSLSQVSISNKKPVIFGVLTTNNELQAKQRAEVKGSEYAKSLLMMIDLFSKDAAG